MDKARDVASDAAGESNAANEGGRPGGFSLSGSDADSARGGTGPSLRSGLVEAGGSDAITEAEIARRGLVRCGGLMAAWGCTDQTVSNYVKAGMRVAGLDRYGRRLFDPKECGRWRSANRAPDGVGGWRYGAGRKKGAKVPRCRGVEGAEAQSLLLPSTPGHLDTSTPSGGAPETTLSPLTVARARDLELKSQEREFKLAELRGDVLPKGEVISAVGEANRRAREVLDRALATLAPEVMRITGAELDKRTLLEDLLCRSFDEVIDELARCPLMESDEATERRSDEGKRAA